MNKKGVGWMSDDIASIFFALLLIVAGFIIFNQVNTLVGKSVTDDVYELHNSYEQQRLLQTYMQTPLIIDGEQGTPQTFIVEFALLDYYMTLHPKDKIVEARRDVLKSDILEDEFEHTMNYYQPLSKKLQQSFMEYAEDVYYVIRLVDTTTGKDVHEYSHPGKLKKQNEIQAIVTLPTQKVGNFGPNQYIVVVEMRKPETTYRANFIKLMVEVNLFTR